MFCCPALPSWLAWQPSTTNAQQVPDKKVSIAASSFATTCQHWCKQTNLLSHKACLIPLNRRILVKQPPCPKQASRLMKGNVTQARMQLSHASHKHTCTETSSTQTQTWPAGNLVASLLLASEKQGGSPTTQRCLSQAPTLLTRPWKDMSSS